VVGVLAVVALASALAVRYATSPKTRSRLHRSDGERATSLPRARPPQQVFEGSAVHAIASSDHEAVAVGDDGLVLGLRTGEARWTSAPSPVKVTLRGVALRLDEAIAVGDDGTVLERDHGAWKLAPKVTKAALRAVVFTSYGAVAVGDGGTLLLRLAPGEPWRVEASGTTADLLAACAGLRDVWLVGRAGTIVTHAALGDLGHPWKVHPSPTAETLFAVACDGDFGSAAVGARGTMITRTAGSEWHETASGTKSDLYAVAAPIGTQSWLVAGAGGVAVRASGTPAALPTGVDWSLRAIDDGAIGTFLGGDRGILRVDH
jgi:hypothetical protein